MRYELEMKAFANNSKLLVSYNFNNFGANYTYRILRNGWNYKENLS